MAELTARQQQVVDCIRSYQIEHDMPPTYRELCGMLGITNTNGVAYHLNRLEKLGVISRVKNKARGITLNEKEWHEHSDNITTLGRWLATARGYSAQEVQGFYEQPHRFGDQWEEFCRSRDGGGTVLAGGSNPSTSCDAGTDCRGDCNRPGGDCGREQTPTDSGTVLERERTNHTDLAVHDSTCQRTLNIEIHKDMPFEKYTALPCVNNSSLSPMLRSPAHYQAQLACKNIETPAMRFGSMFHVAVEARNLSEFWAVEPDLTHDIDSERPRSTKIYKERRAEFEALAAGKEIITQDEWDALNAMLHSVWRNELAASWLRRGSKEVVIVWTDPDTGIQCKCRVDHLAPSIAVDVKTTIDASDFTRTIGKFRYHRQAAFYLDGLAAAGIEVDGFGFVVVEKTEPFACIAATLDEESIAAGRREYKQILKQIAECQAEDYWPGPENPKTFRAPAWALVGDEEVELIMPDGEVMTV